MHAPANLSRGEHRRRLVVGLHVHALTLPVPCLGSLAVEKADSRELEIVLGIVRGALDDHPEPLESIVRPLDDKPAPVHHQRTGGIQPDYKPDCAEPGKRLESDHR